MNINRAPKWDRHRSTFLKVGLACSLALAFMAFNYTSYSVQEEYVYFEPDADPPLEVIPPRLPKEKKVVPPPTPKVEFVELPTDELEFTSDPEPEPVVDNPDIVQPPVDHTQPLAPMEEKAAKVMIVEPEEEANPTPLIIAERMPVFNTCDVDVSEIERRACTQQSMLQHIYKHLKYPKMAKEVGIEGTVVVSFVVDKNGNISDTSVMKDIGGGCGEAVKKIIANLGSFYPGKQNGRPVAVVYRIPVKFELK